jgi:hypothetical protein
MCALPVHPNPRFGRAAFRQVHLDFHTSEHLLDVGGQFDAAQFVRTLKDASVDAINLFAKCHHSWCYYPTKVGRPHPHLKPGLDLFGEQVRACNAAGIRTVAYITVGWSANDANAHPDWCVRNEKGEINHNRAGDLVPPALEGHPDAPFNACFWKFLCPDGAYKAHLLALTREILENYPVDGLWYDICNLEPCWCSQCLAGMNAAGLKPTNRDDVGRYTVRKWDRFLGDCRALVDQLRPPTGPRPGSVFFNGLTHMVTPHTILRHQTHYELEDLPTVWGGYDKLPPRARFFARDGLETIAMSGKFHTAWGEFGGYKHPDAIRYEAATMLAFNARCNFGDQLHPCGVLDEQTYRNIGVAFDYVRQIEHLNIGLTPATNVGVVFGVQPNNFAVHGTSSSAEDEGLCVMLLENQIDFEGVRLADGLAALAGKDLLIVSQRSLSAADAAILRAFAARGGKVVLIGDAALLLDSDRPALDIGADYVGPSAYTIDYTLAGPALRACEAIGVGPFLNYYPAIRLKPTTGEVLAAVREPYFNRTYAHYTSHQYTPYRLADAAHPAVLRLGNVITLTHALGKIYARHGSRQHRELFTAVLDLLGFTPLARARGLGSSGRLTLYAQAVEKRHVLHLTYATPTKRGECEVIEDFPTLTELSFSLALPGVRQVRVTALPAAGGAQVETRDVPFRVTPAGRVEFTLPRLRCHAVITLAH